MHRRSNVVFSVIKAGHSKLNSPNNQILNACSIDRTYYIVCQTLGFGLPLKFPTFGSMVVHVYFRYYKYMYIEEKSARYLVNYKNFVLDHFNYNEFLNF